MPTGGAIVFNGDLSKLKPKRWCGITEREVDVYNVIEPAHNYYMNEISATIGLEQLKKLDGMNERRKDIADMYHHGLHWDRIPFDENCSYHIYWLIVQNRKKFRKKMLEHGIETGVHYTPIHFFDAYAKYYTDLPVTKEIQDKIVSIPMHTLLSDQDVDKVIKVANS